MGTILSVYHFVLEPSSALDHSIATNGAGAQAPLSLKMVPCNSARSDDFLLRGIAFALL